MVNSYIRLAFNGATALFVAVLETCLGETMPLLPRLVLFGVVAFEVELALLVRMKK